MAGREALDLDFELMNQTEAVQAFLFTNRNFLYKKPLLIQGIDSAARFHIALFLF